MQRSLPGAGGPSGSVRQQPEAVSVVLYGHGPHLRFNGRTCESELLCFWSLFPHRGAANPAPHHRCRLFSAACDISAHLHRRTARFKIGPRSLFRDFSTRLLETKKTHHRLFIRNEGKWFRMKQALTLDLVY